LVSALWLEGAPLRIEMLPVGDTATEASVFALYDADGHELLQLGVEGADAVLRYRTVGAALRLDQPDMRLAGAAAALRGKAAAPLPPSVVAAARLDAAQPVVPGPRRRPGGWTRLRTMLATPFSVPRSWRPDSAPGPETGRTPAAQLGGRPDPLFAGPAPTRVRAWRRGPDYCLEVDGRGSCGLGYGVGRSWAVLLYQGGLWRWAALLDALWLLALFLPSGFLLRPGSAPLSVACLVVALALLPPAAGLLPSAAGAWLGGVAGLAAGWGLRRLADGRRGRPQDLAGMRASSERTSTSRQRSMRA